MSPITISLPETTRHWLDKAVRDGGYTDAGAYVRALIDRDREERALTRDELARLLTEAEAGGISERTVDEIAAAAKAKVLRS